MHVLFVVATCVLLVVSKCFGQDRSVDVYAFYLKEKCGGVPNRVDSGNFQGECVEVCGSFTSVWKSINAACNNSESSIDYKEIVAGFFGGASYLLVEKFDSDCETLSSSSALVASNSCEQVVWYMPEWGHGLYEIIHLEHNGSVSLRYYLDDQCSNPSNGSWDLSKDIPPKNADVGADLLNSSTCDENGLRWTYYGSANAASSSSSSNSSGHSGDKRQSISSASGTSDPSLSVATESQEGKGQIVAVVGGLFASVLIVLGLFFYCRRRRSNKSAATSGGNQQRTSSLTADGASAGNLQGQSGLWSDDVITAKRVSRKDVDVLKLITRGAFGEVYEGSFDGRRVAVKMLPPETRGIIHHVNNFLAEAKLTASMEHPRIISVVGVAWNSLSDLCVVLEYMEGGDLRSLLHGYELSKRPTGFDREKATIALHVCHALTYLHSLAPPVIHRDLKSRNILLNQELDAKLTDFGISRERLDQTLTAGVGTSLWMAPEVMLGERYDDKADIFSFGVVLSELDVHTLPYAQSNTQTRDSNGRRLPDAIILQRVAMGKMCVAFSELSPASIVELGTACVSVDPQLRPTASEALYKLQVILAEELKRGQGA